MQGCNRLRGIQFVRVARACLAGRIKEDTARPWYLGQIVVCLFAGIPAATVRTVTQLICVAKDIHISRIHCAKQRLC